VAEGVNFEIHRNTWRYHLVVEQQRQDLAAWREELLTTDAAIRLIDQRLAELEPEPPAEPETADPEAAEPEAAADPEAAEPEAAAEPAAESGTDPEPTAGEAEPTVPDPELRERIARSIALHHLDRCWAEHLASLAEVREGVHLRALGRLDPLDEFHRAAVPAFGQLRDQIERRIVETFSEAEIKEDWEPADVNLLRPSATWTYLVHDNPFGSELERLVSSVSRRLTSRRR
jgi:preprotein translocase subunit SecA